MNINLFRSVAVAAVLVAGAVSSPSVAEQWSTLNGVPIRVATGLTVFEAGDDRLLERLRAELMASVRPSDPLPYATLGSIPDARTLGYGDCKSISVAMRNVLVEQGFARDSLLLAAATTERGDPHMVLLIRGKYRGKEDVRVFDTRVQEITTVARLVEHGYRFEGIENYPGADAVLLNFDGYRLR